MTYRHFCALAAARLCYEAGHSVERIARSAKKSPSTIQRWLKEIGAEPRKDNYVSATVPKKPARKVRQDM